MHSLLGNVAEQLYDGITCADDWNVALGALCRATDSVLFHHVRWDTQAQCVLDGVTNEVLRADKVREYEEHHAAHDPRVPLIMNLPVGELLLDHEYFSPRAMSRSPIYADWLASHGLRHSLGVPVYDDGRTREWVCLIRPLDHSAYGDGVRTLLQRLMPDLLRASRLRARMEGVVAQAAMGMAALDALPQALALVEAGGQLRYANPAAQRMLAAGTGWRLHHGRVCADSLAVQERLGRSVSMACRRAGNAGAKSARAVASTLHAPQNSGPGEFALHVLPLHPAHPLAQVLRERPLALLVWTQKQGAQRLPELAATLGLTETEARLAQTLAQGLSLKDFAQMQGCSWHTARTHIKNLMRKTGLHRQQGACPNFCVNGSDFN
ncbi:hypothetical protein AVS7_02986 [Acidovorax sp. MR-S7]|nr:hypothetical protein AVS7_02986 [Acidovorax sp. MR-S7]